MASYLVCIAAAGAASGVCMCCVCVCVHLCVLEWQAALPALQLLVLHQVCVLCVRVCDYLCMHACMLG